MTTSLLNVTTDAQTDLQTCSYIPNKLLGLAVDWHHGQLCKPAPSSWPTPATFVFCSCWPFPPTRKCGHRIHPRSFDRGVVPSARQTKIGEGIRAPSSWWWEKQKNSMPFHFRHVPCSDFSWTCLLSNPSQKSHVDPHPIDDH